MKLYAFLLGALFMSGMSAVAGNLENILSKPQLDQLQRGYGMFIHYGINTFNDLEWSDGTLYGCKTERRTTTCMEK